MYTNLALCVSLSLLCLIYCENLPAIPQESPHSSAPAEDFCHPREASEKIKSGAPEGEPRRSECNLGYSGAAASPNYWKKKVAIIAGTAAVGTVALPLVAPAAVASLGFGAGGIAAGSWAASLMSTYGGAVGAGSVGAILQSVGAAGLGVTGTLATGTAGAAAGAASAGLVLAAKDYAMNSADGKAESEL